MNNCKVSKNLLENNNKYNFVTTSKNKIELKSNLNENTVKEISKIKDEDDYMLQFRLKALYEFKKLNNPNWGPNLNDIDFDSIKYYVRTTDNINHNWEDLPSNILETFNRLGIPEAEKKYLGGVSTQYESEIIYNNLKKKWQKEGVIFLDTSEAYVKHRELFLKYFGKVVPITDNKYSALNSAVWSGGTFIYIPKNLKVKLPLQTYFRINTQNLGQFERTLIIADEGSEIQYIEGCTAPTYSSESLHAAVVEIVVEKNARVKYTTIQNWSNNVLNLVTKRALVKENGIMEWIDCNLGSKITMKYPSVYLIGNNAHGEILSLAIANKNQNIDSGAKAIHIASNTTSIIKSKSICLNGGISTFRSNTNIAKGSLNSKTETNCEAIILDNNSKTNTYPNNIISEPNSKVTHEASVSKIDIDKLNYLCSRGLSEANAKSLIIAGFFDPIVKDLPMEYAVELNTLINMSMEGSVG